MDTLSDIRAAIAAALRTVDGLEGIDHAPPQVNPPAAVVAPDSVQYDVDFEHGATYLLPVQMIVGLGDWESAQRQMDAMVAHDGTAVAAINAIDSFECRVVAMGDYGTTAYGDKTYLGAVLTVEVLV